MGSIPETGTIHPNPGNMSFNSHCLVNHIGGLATGTSTFTQNKVYYMPVWLPYRITVKNFWWWNGSNTTAGHVDVGLYDAESRAKIASSGDTVRAGFSAKQSVALASNIVLWPGAYYFGFVYGSAAGDFAGWTGAALERVRAAGFLEDTGTGVPLPATISEAQISVGHHPYVGMDLV